MPSRSARSSRTFRDDALNGTLSKRRHYVLAITYKALKVGLVHVNAAKTESLQVKLQAKNSAGIEQSNHPPEVDPPRELQSFGSPVDSGIDAVPKSPRCNFVP
jgi:hypothetical protein